MKGVPMSFNIDTWKTKRIEDLTIPMSAIRELPYVRIEMVDENQVLITGPSEGFEIHGTLSKKDVHVASIASYGESSGNSFDELLDMLKTSTGTLVATQVWEGGELITRLTVKNGVVTKKKVEI
jgi:hypothetical protein